MAYFARDWVNRRTFGKAASLKLFRSIDSSKLESQGVKNKLALCRDSVLNKNSCYQCNREIRFQRTASSLSAHCHTMSPAEPLLRIDFLPVAVRIKRKQVGARGNAPFDCSNPNSYVKLLPLAKSNCCEPQGLIWLASQSRWGDTSLPHPLNLHSNFCGAIFEPPDPESA